MKLTFIHGWGFDARFWNALSELLPQYEQQRVDLGFFGAPTPVLSGEPGILVGHSLGFVHGLKLRQDWRGWIAINSFARFVRTATQPGCVEAAELRELRMRMTTDPASALQRTYEKLEAHPPAGTPDIPRLLVGLDELRDCDVSDILENIDVPGLVLAGREDHLVPPKTSLALCGHAPHGSVTWHETGGHMLPARDPVWCAKAIESFLG